MDNLAKLKLLRARFEELISSEVIADREVLALCRELDSVVSRVLKQRGAFDGEEEGRLRESSDADSPDVPSDGECASHEK